MGTVNKVVGWIEHVLSWVSMFFLGTLTIFVTADVVMRYAFNAPILGADDLSQDYLLPIVIWPSVAFVFSSGFQVRVTVLTQRLPTTVQRYLEVGMDLLGLLLYVAITIAGWQQFQQAVVQGERASNILQYPMAPAYFLVPLGAGLLCIRLIVDILRIAFGYQEEKSIISPDVETAADVSWTTPS